jgi:hypothetical protein
MVVAYQVRRVLELSTNNVSDLRMLISAPSPHKLDPTISLGHLTEGPGNMGESQHEPLVRIGDS